AHSILSIGRSKSTSVSSLSISSSSPKMTSLAIQKPNVIAITGALLPATVLNADVATFTIPLYPRLYPVITPCNCLKSLNEPAIAPPTASKAQAPTSCQVRSPLTGSEGSSSGTVDPPDEARFDILI